MSDDIKNPGDGNLDDRINRETGVISWSDLAQHFARGVVIIVSPAIDLIDAAACLSRDDTDMLQAWLDGASVRRASDDDARDWVAREPNFWCVVTAPWVLVQEKGLTQNETTPPIVH